MPRVLNAMAALEDHLDRDRLGPPLLAEAPDDRNVHEPGHPEDAPDEAQLVAAADKALYAAKQRGRDRAVAFSEL